MDQYVDGFLLSVPNDKLDTYQQMATKAGAIWKEHGALAYCECTGDDLDIEGMVSFKTSAAAREGETVVFAWIVYASRAERDRINAAVMADPRLKEQCVEGVFDFKRMAYGGFKTLVNL